MKDSSDSANRSAKIAEIMREYAKSDVDRAWLLNKNKDPDNEFKKSFHAIYDYTKDFDLALWYPAFSQTFGGKTDPMLQKVAEMCTDADRDLIMLKRAIPEKCPYSRSKENAINYISAKNFDSFDKKGIKEKIYDIYKSAKFSRDAGEWCNLKKYENCEYRADCPIDEWINLINKHKLRYRSEPKIFFYYDSLCLLNNSAIKNFNQLFSKLGIRESRESTENKTKENEDRTKATVIIRSLLDQIRGIGTKSLLFLQMEKLFNARDLDYAELIFTDKLARRVAERIEFPFYQTDWVDAIKEFGETYTLNARQIDRALWETGFICTAEGCRHGVNGSCIFHDICAWSGKR
jgi:hypothetical protein